MHELGIVFYIIRDVKKAAEENNVKHVSAVVMSIGEVSTIIPDYLQDCWRWAADKEEMLKGCELKIEPLPAVTHCDGCGKDYPTVAHGKICPHCGSENTWLLRGNEVEIKQIDVYYVFFSTFNASGSNDSLSCLHQTNRHLRRS